MTLDEFTEKLPRTVSRPGMTWELLSDGDVPLVRVVDYEDDEMEIAYKATAGSFERFIHINFSRGSESLLALIDMDIEASYQEVLDLYHHMQRSL